MHGYVAGRSEARLLGGGGDFAKSISLRKQILSDRPIYYDVIWEMSVASSMSPERIRHWGY